MTFRQMSWLRLAKAPIFEVCDEDLVLIAIRKRVHDAVSLTIFSPNE